MVSMTDIDKDTVDKSYQHLASALRRLITRTRDSAAGYRKAAEETLDDYLRPQFEQLADERDRLAATLASVAKDLSIDIADEDNALGDVHRAFLGFKVKLLRSEPEAILSEVARGEAAFERLFERVLHLSMPQSARRKLQAQHRIVREARDHYRSLARRVRRHGSTAMTSASRRLARVGASARQHPIATVGIIAASALVLSAIATLASHDKPRWSLDMPQLRGLEKRLRRLEKRGLRQFEDYHPRDLEKRARRGLESIGRHLGYR